MKRAFIIFKAVTRNWLRSKAGLFFSIMFPVLLLIVFGAIFSGGGTGKSTLFVQNLDIETDGQPSQLSTAFVEALNSTETFAIQDVPMDKDAKTYAREALGPLGGNIRILVISEGFQDDMLNGTLKVRIGISFNTTLTMYRMFNSSMTPENRTIAEAGIAQMGHYNENLTGRNTTLTLIFDQSDQSASVIENIVMNVASAFNYGLIGATTVIEFQRESVVGKHFGMVDFYLPGIIAAFIMTNGIIALTSNTTEFKRRGIIKRLSITPLTKFDWIIGNVLSQTLLSLLLTAIMIMVGWIVFNLQVIPDALSIIFIFLGSIMFSGIGMVLGGLVKDVEAASAIGNAIAFPMMFLSGTYFPIDFAPSYIQAISKVLPLTYFSDGLRYALIYKYNEGVFTNMAVVSVLAVVFIILGSVVTRWKEK